MLACRCSRGKQVQMIFLGGEFDMNDKKQEPEEIVRRYRSRWIPTRIAMHLATHACSADSGSVRESTAWRHAQGWWGLSESQAVWHGLMLRGETGTGKTFSACGVVSGGDYSFGTRPSPHCLRDGNTVFSEFESSPAALFVRASDLAGMLMGSGFGRKDPRLAWLTHCPLIAIDDLGREPSDSGSYMASGLFDLFARRFDESQRTVVTTNLDEGSFVERYGVAVYDRFCAQGVVSDLKDSDYQRQQALS